MSSILIVMLNDYIVYILCMYRTIRRCISQPFQLLLQFAFVYMINGMFGQAIIILPKLVSRTGLLLSTLLLTCIAGVNFITTTHVLEAMGIANACYRLEERRGKSETKEMDVSIHIDISHCCGFMSLCKISMSL